MASSLSNDAQGTTISKLFEANSKVSEKRNIMYIKSMRVDVNIRIV
jgi:hypothetical protein